MGDRSGKLEIDYGWQKTCWPQLKEALESQITIGMIGSVDLGDLDLDWQGVDVECTTERSNGMLMMRRGTKWLAARKDVTVRYRRKSGADTTAQKIESGRGDWFCWAWFDWVDEAWRLACWILVSLERVREERLIEKHASSEQWNDDGSSSWIAIPLRSLSESQSILTHRGMDPYLPQQDRVPLTAITPFYTRGRK